MKNANEFEYGADAVITYHHDLDKTKGAYNLFGGIT